MNNILHEVERLLKEEITIINQKLLEKHNIKNCIKDVETYYDYDYEGEECIRVIISLKKSIYKNTYKSSNENVLGNVGLEIYREISNFFKGLGFEEFVYVNCQ